MISQKELSRLATLKSPQGVVSAYVKIDPKLAYNRQAHAAQFKGAVRAFLRGGKNGHLRAALDRESPRILRLLEERPPDGRGLAVFACEPAGIWEVAVLDVPVPSFVDVNASPAIEVLTRVLDEYPSFAVAVVQRDSARIYLSEQRASEEQAAIESEVPGRHEQGGWSQARFQRHIEVHVQKHLKEVVDELERLFYERGYSRLAIGGPLEAVDELVKMLPDPVARRVIGTFSVDLKHETDQAVLDRARQLGDEAERRQERELVQQAIDAADAGGRGVAGLDATLRAVFDGRIHVLLVADGATTEGSACPNCGYFAAGGFDRCPACDSQTEAVPDVIEHAVERAFLSGAQIETVFGEPRDWLLARGGLAAVLRY